MVGKPPKEVEVADGLRVIFYPDARLCEIVIDGDNWDTENAITVRHEPTVYPEIGDVDLGSFIIQVKPQPNGVYIFDPEDPTGG